MFIFMEYVCTIALNPLNTLLSEYRIINKTAIKQFFFSLLLQLKYIARNLILMIERM